MHKQKKKHVDMSGQVFDDRLYVQFMCKMHSWKSKDVWATKLTMQVECTGY